VREVERQRWEAIVERKRVAGKRHVPEVCVQRRSSPAHSERRLVTKLDAELQSVAVRCGESAQSSRASRRRRRGRGASCQRVALLFSDCQK
jgi:hypothetical protein